MAETGTVVQDDAERPDEEFTDQTEFLNAIHPSFLSLAFPIECGLVDHLKASHVFDSEDEDNVRAEKSRKNRARQCWSRLTRVPPKQFHDHCIPALEATCASVVEGKKFRWDGSVEGCLHHLLKRTVPLRRFADMFPGTGGCSHEEYRKIIEGNSHDDTLWDLVFKLCSRNKDNAAFRSLMETTLKSMKVPVPADLPLQLASRVPCACVKTGTKRKQKNSKERKKGKKSHKKFKKEAHETTETEKHSIASATETFSLAKSNSSSNDADLQQPVTEPCPAAADQTNNARRADAKEEEDDDYCFASEKQKDTFLKQLEEINETITKVSGMKAIFHEVSGIQVELATLSMQTRAEASEETILRYKGKTLRLRAKIRDIREKLQRNYKQALRFMKKFEPTGLDARVPSKFESTLQERREVLVSEFTEAESFYEKSCDIFNILNVNREKTATDSLPAINKYITIEEICQNIVDALDESGVEILYDGTDDAFEEFSFESDEDKEAIGFDEYRGDSHDGEDDIDDNYEEDDFSFTDEEDDIDVNDGEGDIDVNDGEDDIDVDDGEDDIDNNYEEDDISFTDEEDDIDVNDGEDDIDVNDGEDDIDVDDGEDDIDVNDGEDDIDVNDGEDATDNNYEDDNTYFGEDDDADFDDEESGASDEEGDWC